MLVKLLQSDLNCQKKTFAEKRLLFETPESRPGEGPSHTAEEPKESPTAASREQLGAMTGDPVAGIEDAPKFEIAVDKKIDVDSRTGYRVAIYAPKAWDGTLDVYLPGDTYTLESAIDSKHLKEKFIAKGQSGKMCALAVIEGSREHIRGRFPGDTEVMKHRYDELQRPGSLSSILSGIGRTIGGEVTSVNFMGHSRGGSALNNILSSGADASKISTISCLDSTYFSAEPLIAFANRGGQLNVAFKPGTGTESKARRIIQSLGLTKISGNHWASADGKVNVYEAPELSHSEIADKYSGIFMGSEHHGSRDPSFVPSQADTSYAYTDPQVEASPPGALHGVVAEKLTALETALDVNGNKLAEADDNKLRSGNIEDIRFNSRFLVPASGEEDDPIRAQNFKQETYRRIKAYTSSYDKDWYTVDYAKMGTDPKGRSHENFIGLGDILLDPDIKEILIDRGGQIIKATRGFVTSDKHAGRLGFLDTEGNYVATHTGDKFRILKPEGDNIAEESDLSSPTVLATYMAAINDEESKRELEKAAFAKNPDNYDDDAGYYAGTTVKDYKFEATKYSDEDVTSKKMRHGVPEEVSKRYVEMMGYSQTLNYYDRMCGRPPNSGWLLKNPLNVFGTTLNRPNIILACMLVELEERCKAMGMVGLKFKDLSSTADTNGLHALGLAIDFDPGDNYLNTPENTTWTIPLAMAEELQKMGFEWGMYFFKSRDDGKTDPMHFDIRTSLPNAMAMLTSDKAKDMAMSFQAPGKGMSLYDYGVSLAGKTH